MLQSDQVQAAAKKKDDENWKFRTFLKNHANWKKLDQQFVRLHKELFSQYDCSTCRNCCKMYRANIPNEDIEKDAAYLGITQEQFIDFFLQKNDFELEYQTKHKPCDFLNEDGSCKLGECKPESCKLYPYTDQPDRMESLGNFMSIVKICPVAYEICERLKQEYGFRRR